MKYLKYYAATFELLAGIYFCSIGSYYSSVFFILTSMIIVLGDIYIGEDASNHKYKYHFLLNFPIYINLSLLYIYLFMIIFIFGNQESSFLITFYNDFLYIDLEYFKNSVTLFDKISLITLTALFIGIMGTVPGHELTHRKKNKFDMFVGNWLLALSWDCAFAVEHVYGHHKNVCLSGDPATAKRGENIYLFILRAIIKEQKDAWKIELKHLRRRGYAYYSYNNKMLLGYFRSLIITFLAYAAGGLLGMFFYLLCALIAKSFLEVINYTEHYGLVRVEGEPVGTRHSWNSNSIISSILLFNLTRHSSHHEKTNLQYWELDAYPDAPMMPQGYLCMLYLAILCPPYYNKIMAKKLIEWDEKYATPKERELATIQNKNSGISILEKFSL